MAIEKTYVAIDLAPDFIGRSESSPLHMTLTPPVKVELEEARAIARGLHERLHGFGAVMLRAADDDWFGQPPDLVRVRKFEHTPELRKLHNIALSVVSEVTPVDTTFTGENYHPHASYQGERGIGEGETRTVEEVVVLRKQDGAWVRFADIPLGQSE